MKRYLYIMTLVAPCLLQAVIPGQDLIKKVDRKGSPILDSKGNPIYIPKTIVINEGDSIGVPKSPGQNVVIKTRQLDNNGNPVYIPVYDPPHEPLPWEGRF